MSQLFRCFRVLSASTVPAGGPNFNEDEFDETYCGAAPSKDGQNNRRQLPEYIAGDDDASLVDCCYPCRRVEQFTAPARHACYRALCLNNVSRLAHYEARVAVNSAGNHWDSPSPTQTNPCLARMCDGCRSCAGSCDAARVRCNAVLCENAACKCCCGGMTRAMEKAGGEWEIDLSRGLPHVAVGIPSGLHLPALPAAGVRGILRGREDARAGATEEGAEEALAAEGAAGALTQTRAPEPVTWRQESGEGEPQAASGEGEPQAGGSVKSAEIEESDPAEEETATKTADLPAGARD